MLNSLAKARWRLGSAAPSENSARCAWTSADAAARSSVVDIPSGLLPLARIAAASLSAGVPLDGFAVGLQRYRWLGLMLVVRRSTM